jgi:2-phosphoglycerate kinase
MDTFEKYNNAWSEGKIKKPLIVLIGGYCGTGKSTFAALLASKIQHTNVLTTGIPRAIYQSLFDRESKPELYGHTYHLFTQDAYKDIPFEKAVVTSYLDQVHIVQSGIKNIVTFANTEGAQYIIEGTHVIPEFADEYKDEPNVISVFLKASDSKSLIKNMDAETHRRNLSEEEKNAAIILHDYNVQEAQKYNLPLFTFDETESALSYVEERLERLL